MDEITESISHDTMDDLFEEIKSQIQSITGEYFDELRIIWKRIFNQNDCKVNLEQLVVHIGNIYQELIYESKGKEESIINRITSLKSEAESLKKLLRTDLTIQIERDAPLLVVEAALSNGVEELRERLRQRKDQIYELLVEQESLCEELGESPHPLQLEPFPTAEKIEEFEQYLEKLRDERKERLNKVTLLRREIKELLEQLEIEATKDIELLHSPHIKLNKESILGLIKMRDCYASQKQEIHQRIDEMKGTLETLWDCLGTSPTTRSKLARYTQYNQSAFDAYYSELNRCQMLRSQNIKKFVSQIREKIVEWWNKTLQSEEQRQHFKYFYSNSYTEDLLLSHETALKDLQCYYENNKEIFELYENRKILWDRMTALELKALDPGRYNNRGGQLLKEEKERKVIQTKLPKIEQRIKQLVIKYEEREQQPFLVFGENILDVIAAEWENLRQTKAQFSSARKKSHSPKVLVRGTPMALKNSSTGSMGRTPLQSRNRAIQSSETKKRKLNAADKLIPLPKRSLLYSVNKPGTFLKPSNEVKRSPSKSPQKTTRVLGTINRRRLSRQSHGATAKKKCSMNKVNTLQPKIVITNSSSDQLDTTYSCFEKSIGPAARSSINPNSNCSASTPRGSKTRLACTEGILALSTQSPSTKNSFTTSITGSGRKLMTKNLPIIF